MRNLLLLTFFCLSLITIAPKAFSSEYCENMAEIQSDEITSEFIALEASSNRQNTEISKQLEIISNKNAAYEADLQKIINDCDDSKITNELFVRKLKDLKQALLAPN